MTSSTRIVHVSLTDALTKGPPPPGNLAVPFSYTVRSWLSCTHRLAMTHKNPTCETRLILSLAANHDVIDVSFSIDEGRFARCLVIDQITGHFHSVEIRKRILDPLQLTNT